MEVNDTSKSHLDEWLSEYPDQRIYIMRRHRYFESNPPPKGDTTPEWEQILHDLESDTSIGNESSKNSNESPWEPPF